MITKTLLFSVLLLLPLTGTVQQSLPDTPPEVPPASSIQWMTFDQAIDACRRRGRLILIDMYTDWCRWCKEMDRDTFRDPKVAAYINKYYYPVKFNVEKAGPVHFRGKTYQLLDAGSKQIHALAWELLDGKIAYPAFVVLDPYLRTVHVTKGYWKPEPFLTEIKWLVRQHR